MNGNDRFPQLFWGLAVLAVGLVITGLVAAGAVRAAKRASDTITVTGSARKAIRSDRVTWGGSYFAFTKTMPESYQLLKSREERIRQYLKAHQVPDSSITFSGVHSQQIFHSKTAEFLGYRMDQRFDITSTRVDSINALARAITELAGEGIELTSDSPQFYYTKLNDLRVAMLAEATKDAKTRAEEIARSAGGRIRSLRSARQGVFQITAPDSREVRDYGIYDTSTIEKDITAVVSVTFSVE